MEFAINIPMEEHRVSVGSVFRELTVKTLCPYQVSFKARSNSCFFLQIKLFSLLFVDGNFGCNNFQCHNGGSCLVTKGVACCTCLPGFTGLRCETSIIVPFCFAE